LNKPSLLFGYAVNLILFLYFNMTDDYRAFSWPLFAGAACEAGEQPFFSFPRARASLPLR
jgi:hypothetical protein